MREVCCTVNKEHSEVGSRGLSTLPTVCLLECPCLGLHHAAPGQAHVDIGIVAAATVHQSVYSVATNPRGDLVLTGSADNVVRLWDTRTTNRVGALKGHRDLVKALQLGDDGRRCLTGSSGERAGAAAQSQMIADGRENPPGLARPAPTLVLGSVFAPTLGLTALILIIATRLAAGSRRYG